jgi:hypothetical protein
MIKIFWTAVLLTACQASAIDPTLLKRAGRKKINKDVAKNKKYGPPTTTVECYDKPTTTTLCVTETPVPPSDDCTLPLTYWKQNPDKVTSLTLGSVKYPKQLIVSILNTPNTGGQNGLVALAKQLAVAKLNYYGRRACETTKADIKAADELIGNTFVHSQTNGFLDINVACSILKRLESCNRGSEY